MNSRNHNVNYTIACTTQLWQDITQLTRRQRTSAGAVVRAVLLTFTGETIAKTADPGEPQAGDRVIYQIKSGAHAGKIWRRKPRLQLRLAAGYSHATIRQALALALQLDRENLNLHDAPAKQLEQRIIALERELEHYKDAVKILKFTLPATLCHDLQQAAVLLGLDRITSVAQAKRRYRHLVRVYHPDSYTGDSDRMLHLNAAIAYVQQTLA